MMRQTWIDAIRRRFGRYGALSCSILAASFAAASLGSDVYDKATSELVAIFSLLMAGVLPTAVLAGTVLRAGGLSKKRLIEYRNALLTQVKVWARFFSFAFSGCILIILGKMSSWTIRLPSSWVPWKTSVEYIDISNIFNFGITLSLALLSLRVFAIFRGIYSLVLLSSEIALSEADQRDSESFAKVAAEIENIPPREGFGRRISLPEPQIPQKRSIGPENNKL